MVVGGISLLSSTVMILRHEQDLSCRFDVRLEPGSFYIQRYIALASRTPLSLCFVLTLALCEPSVAQLGTILHTKSQAFPPSTRFVESSFRNGGVFLSCY